MNQKSGSRKERSSALVGLAKQCDVAPFVFEKVCERAKVTSGIPVLDLLAKKGVKLSKYAQCVELRGDTYEAVEFVTIPISYRKRGESTE